MLWDPVWSLKRQHNQHAFPLIIVCYAVHGNIINKLVGGISITFICFFSKADFVLCNPKCSKPVKWITVSMRFSKSSEKGTYTGRVPFSLCIIRDSQTLRGPLEKGDKTWFFFDYIYSAFANSCPLQTDTFLFPLIHSHDVILSSNKF